MKRTKPKPKAKKPRRVVLGVGHPWFSLTTVALTKAPVHESILLRLSWKNLGNWNKIRLVAEVLK